VPAAFVYKRRVDGDTTEVTGVSAEVRGKRVVIYDDMIRTGGSLVGAARAYRDAGADASTPSPPTASSRRLDRAHPAPPACSADRRHRQPPARRSSSPRLPRGRAGRAAARSLPFLWACPKGHLHAARQGRRRRAQPDPRRLGRQPGPHRPRDPAARAQGAALVCLPELCIPGYGCEDAFFSAAGAGPSRGASCRSSCPRPAGWRSRSACRSCTAARSTTPPALVVDGAIAGFVAKRFLAGDGIHYEPRWFKPWPAGKHIQWKHDGKTYPLGDLLFESAACASASRSARTRGSPTAPAPSSRCAASTVPEPVGQPLRLRQVRGPQRIVDRGQPGTFGVGYVYTNLLGNEAGRVVYDGERPGRLRRQADRRGPALRLRRRVPHRRHGRHRPGAHEPQPHDLHPRRRRQHARVVQRGQLPDVPYIAAPPSRSPPLARPEVREAEEFTRAVALGLFDYLRKSRSPRLRRVAPAAPTRPRRAT
jgi:hypothetical protein